MTRRYTGVSDDIRALIMDRSRGCCERCGYGASDVQIHHRRPRGMGGTRRPETNTASACVLLCASCHRIVESHRSQAYEEGWLVHQSHDPLAQPVFRRGVWVLLDNEGFWYRIPDQDRGVS